ncbi:N-acetyllactosaminide beta-1,3-N-acetylglucosaminyltransferase-like protein 1 [Sarcoptes scabiei]|nr:N-acetyllactosaminide beta-1,3-N-acetylglucosaminyltransferase-like protein 1 [Sarcoptes scabiei]
MPSGEIKSLNELSNVEKKSEQQPQSQAIEKNAKQVGQIVDKLFDSNNRPVIQDVNDGNNNGPSYKHIEEDDRTIDENDKLRIEMLGAKPDEQNSIIHLDLDYDDKKSDGSNSDQSKRKNEKIDAKKPHLDDLSKEVINQIMEHNLHIKKNDSNLIIPDSSNIAPSIWTPEIRGKYSVLQDYVPGNDPIDSSAETITLTTQGGPDFLYHAEELCKRWDGPISLAVYAPGDDFRLSLNIIYYMRQCANKCVIKRVFWHLVYDSKFPPANKINGPTSFLESQNFNCQKSLEETMKDLNILNDFRKSNSLTYPINVLRNVARLATKSKYLLASDIELYPSVGIIPSFFKMLEFHSKTLSDQKLKDQLRLPHVFVLPIFEVKADKKAPRTKEELSKLFKSKDAIFFHKYVCDLCQNFPDRMIWIQQIPKIDSMNVFRVTRRTRERNQWEPLYIGTNNEPFYDERLTWEGKRDKMSQMYHMCLLNYQMMVLDNAFLVHAPGIKRYSVKDDRIRLEYIKQNQKIYTSVLADLRRKFSNSTNVC